MKKIILIAALLVISTSSFARSLNVDGVSVGIGDHLSKIYDGWGSPQYRVTSDKTCHPYDKKKCSYSRLVWKRSNTFYLVQEVRSKIIKISTTKSEANIRKAF